MTREEITMNSIIKIGMDVHMKTYNLCAINATTGEKLGEVKCEGNVKNILKFIENIKKKVDGECEIETGYEAGCLGFSLYHELSFHDVKCIILAPSTMQGSVKNKKVKNDKMDAMMIANNLVHGTYRPVHVPKDHDLEIREYIGLREDVVNSNKRIKQQICALVLRYGFRYDGKSKWTDAHIKWLYSLELSDITRETLNRYLEVYDFLKRQIEKYNERIEEFSKEDTYEEPIKKMICFKGINTLSAMKIQSCVSDFERFPAANNFMSFIGLLPGESSSSDDYHNKPITKLGNTMLRKTLIECTQALVKGTVGKKSKALKSRQKGQDEKVIKYADKAVERLQKKFKSMIFRGKPYNVAITAAARELAGFIWGMETGNID